MAAQSSNDEDGHAPSLFEDIQTDILRFPRKFGKHIQKRQLDIPEYAASFVDYKALKKLIKKLSATPVIPPQNEAGGTPEHLDPQSTLQANKATFFFRLERELEKVNTFYLQKEAELKLRLATLLDKKRAMQQRTSTSKTSSKYIALEEGFRQFSSDLNKLQQFVEVNATAFSKILKKWDKASKSRTKELYLSRAVEVQPCFNRDVISDLSDQATTNLLDFAAWAEGEKMQLPVSNDQGTPDSAGIGEVDLDPQILAAISAGNTSAVEEWLSRMASTPEAQELITRAFLGTLDDAPESTLKLLLDTNLVNLHQVDEINERNCLHRAAITGRDIALRIGLAAGVNVKEDDVYGRIPLHYACIHGRVEMIESLLQAAPETVDEKDQDNFTPLIHSIAHAHLECVQKLLAHGAQIDPTGPNDHIPLNLACQHDSLPIVELLLNARAQILPDAEGLYPQHLVARTGKLPQLFYVLKQYGVDLDQPDKLYQWTPLFHAASEGHVECLKTLLEVGVRADIRDEKGLAAMYYAIWEGHLECMKLLASATRGAELPLKKQVSPPMLSGASQPAPPAMPPPSSTPLPMTMEAEGIPDLYLPPPIIPLRRYGHNFLDTKTFVVVNFADGANSIQFYEENKYPAARLTISSKSSDLIPRNILLPLQEDSRTISFQIDNLDTFSIDFDVYPTFGARVIARTVASSRVFTGRASSSGHWHLELFDPRLRAIGRISFNFQVVKPFHGIPLEITHFATYWKATSQLDSDTSTLITGSSLSGEYVRLFVQLTSDGVVVLYPRWTVNHYGLEVPINSLSYAQFAAIGAAQGIDTVTLQSLPNATVEEIPRIHQVLANSFCTLEDALKLLPANIHVEVHILYPNSLEELRLRLGPTPNINVFADALLSVVFDHARQLRENADGFVRSIVFSSFNPDICTALNWKQPNYPVLLCNELGADPSCTPVGSQKVQSSGRTTISVKQAVQTAQNNNFMGLICSSRLLDLAPALIESIKTAGLVLITDISDSSEDLEFAPRTRESTVTYHVPEGVDGYLRGNGVLRFNETIDL